MEVCIFRERGGDKTAEGGVVGGERGKVGCHGGTGVAVMIRFKREDRVDFRYCQYEDCIRETS